LLENPANRRGRVRGGKKAKTKGGKRIGGQFKQGHSGKMGKKNYIK